jgi:hypothetical protein
MATSPARRVAVAPVDVICRIVGRHDVVRAARFRLQARRGAPNDGRTECELALHGRSPDRVPRARRIDAVDVGANVGQWSNELVQGARRLSVRLGPTELAPVEESADALAAQLRCLIEDLAGRARMADAAAKWARARFDPAAYSDRVAEIRLGCPSCVESAVWSPPGWAVGRNSGWSPGSPPRRHTAGPMTSPAGALRTPLLARPGSRSSTRPTEEDSRSYLRKARSR